ncbi:hypothetical protein DLJ49_02510 [Rhodovulum sp. 12E13]|uniref:hypothetical protein n=1 Tax=Rhodovulum sp. 12E13 TaxID=2203891 RepID=UPI000E1806B7|nr:hypothetical protein [Rhodovulum sp. 12E13]RDC74873.1 hypothetical protein DLJ49_02510 [Rhodovulum sp. 12E13]
MTAPDTASLRSIAAVMAVLLWPACAWGQARILSGEHEDFSRLAVILPAQTEWDAERVEGGWRVTFEPPVGQIDLGRVFDLIPRDRIEAVRQDEADGSLFIASACDCHLDAFDAGPSVVALDVKHGPDPDAVDARQPGATPSASAPASSALPADLTIRSTATPAQAVPPPVPPAVPQTGIRSAPLPQRPSDLAAEALDRAIAGANLEASLREDMRRAAEAGLVELADDQPPATRATGPAPAAEPRAPPDTRAPENAAPPVHDDAKAAWGTDAPPPDPERNIALRTSLAPARPDDGAAAGLDPCPPADRFAFFHGHGTSDELLGRLPELRAGIVDEAGALDPEGARRLTEAWLALGFGAEAAALAEDSPLPAPLTQTYGSLARILDFGRDEAPLVWSGMQRCPSAAALWAFLGHTPEPGAPPTDSGALQRAFFALPAHLRLQTGPDLATLLRLRGLPAAAAAIDGNLAVLNAPDGRPPDPGPDDPDEDGASDTVGTPRIVPGQSQARVDALLDDARSRLERNRLPAPDDLAVAEALTREHAGTERGDRLEGLVGLRLLADGDLDTAAEILLRPGRPEDPGWRAALRGATAATIAAMPDSDLLALALHPSAPGLMQKLTSAQAADVADRLTKLGFPALGLAALETIEITPGSAAERARARATLATGDAARALALVAGQNTPEAARLRGAALAQLGSHALAAAAFAAAGEPERAAREAWLSGDADSIERYGNQDQRDLAAAILPPRARPETDTADSAAQAVIPAVTSATAPGGTAPAASTMAADAGADPRQPLDDGTVGVSAAADPPEARALPDSGPPSLSAARSLVDDTTSLRQSLERLLDASQTDP